MSRRSERRARRRTVAIGAAAVLIPLLAVLVWLARRRPESGTDTQVVAAAPFAVDGTDPSLTWVGEGMADLLATRLAMETRVRPVDPRALLAAWRRAAGAPDAALPRDRAAALARDLDAEAVIVGTVRRAPQGIALSAELVAAHDASVAERAEVAGPADSLAALVDQLATRLLPRATAGARLAAAASASPAALRAWVEGRALLRRGRAAEAAARDVSALAADSTFALAALGVVDAVLFGAPADAGAAARLLHASRARLTPRDRALADVYLGAAYPAPRSGADWRAAAERLAAIAPDAPEGAYHRGAWAYHYGLLADQGDAAATAVEQLERALALDSTYLPAAERLPELYLAARDTAGLRRSVRRLAALDRQSPQLPGILFLTASYAGDSNAVRRLRGQMDRMPSASLAAILRGVRHDALAGVADGARAAALYRDRARQGNGEGRAVLLDAGFALDRGRPAEAAQVLESDGEPAGRIVFDLLFHAFGGGDSAAARRSAAAADSVLRTNDPRDPGTASLHWLLGADALALGDTTGARRRLQALAAAAPLALVPGDSVATRVGRERLARAALTLETQLAAATSGRGLPTLAARLDSAQRAGADPLADDATSLVLARAWEALGDLPHALAAARRRTRGVGNELFWAAKVREQARLAERVGDRAAAASRWREYLRLRADPEPAVRAEVDSARASLARLEQAIAGR